MALAQLLAETNFVVEQGDTVELLLGPITVYDPQTKATTPVDLTAATTELWLTAKHARSDADNAAAFQKTGIAGGASSGIALNSPATSDKNWATITIAPADTASLTAPLELVYDVQLLEASGRKTTLRRGTISVAEDVTNA